MEYRGFEYAVVRTMSPNGWRWSVKRDQHRDRVGNAGTLDDAVTCAKKFIDRVIKARARLQE